MNPSANQAPDELTTLRELVSALQKENSLLRQKIDALCRRVFGSSSEKIDASQLELLLQMVNSGEAAEAKTAAPVEKASEPARPRKERAPRVPENLPVVEQVIEPQEVIEQPEQWRLIGQEVSEQLDYEPAPSGTNLRPTAQNQFAAPDAGQLGGTLCGLALADLRTNPHWRNGWRLRAGG